MAESYTDFIIHSGIGNLATAELESIVKCGTLLVQPIGIQCFTVVMTTLGQDNQQDGPKT